MKAAISTLQRGIKASETALAEDAARAKEEAPVEGAPAMADETPPTPPQDPPK
jgi:hypothetical protein